MSNQLSPELLAELFGQASDDPFLMLVTLTHPSFPEDIRLVNNTQNITSRSEEYQAFPMLIRLPVDDGESAREVDIEFDNVSLELIEELRSITTPMEIKIEMILASTPDDVQISLEELKLKGITYDRNRIKARLYLDNFLNVEMTSERYAPTNFPGLF